MEEYITEAPRVVTVPTEPLVSTSFITLMENVIVKITEILCLFPYLQLQLTYRPEEEEPTTEDTKSSVEEQEHLPQVENVVHSNSEPAPSPPQSQNNFETGDLLVDFPYQSSFISILNSIFL